MSGNMKWMASCAFLLVALDSFEKDSTHLGIPHWLWVIVGIVWLLHIPALFTEKQP